MISDLAAGSVQAIDLNGDSDADVLFTGGEPAAPGVAWCENLGAGVFGPIQTIYGGKIISANAADLDGDGDADVLVGGSFNLQVAWCENLGAGMFGPLQSLQAGTCELVGFVRAEDLDGDGDADVLASSELYGNPGGGCSSKTVYLENLGGGVFLPGVLVSSSFNYCDAADLDGDGSKDLVLGYDNYINWMDNRTFTDRW